jgi:hypothetical protein
VFAALDLVSAWASTNRLVLAQVAVAEGSNEIPAIPALLQLLVLRGCIVTIDAIGCQTAIAAAIREQGADYVLALKENQEGLFGGVTDAFAALSAGRMVLGAEACSTGIGGSGQPASGGR